ncbi:Protein MON2, partial [Bienertia sinuspersici]
EGKKASLNDKASSSLAQKAANPSLLTSTQKRSTKPRSNLSIQKPANKASNQANNQVKQQATPKSATMPPTILLNPPIQTLTKLLPPDWSICIGRPMEEPCMGIMHPLSHKMEVQLMKWEELFPEPLKMLLTMTLPLTTRFMINQISEAHIDTLQSIPLSMQDRIPIFKPNLPPLTFLVWNVQGAGIALVKTYMGSDQAELIATKFSFGGHMQVDVDGFAGGILVYWRTDSVTVSKINQSAQHITMEVTRTGEVPWRQELWAFLKNYAASHNHPWLVSGDFNDTRFDWERSNCSDEVKRRAKHFNALVEDMELIELEFSGPSHTWARGLSDEIRKSARLDRALCNSAWATRFTNASIKVLPAIQSDHCPLFISPNGFAPLNSINKPFRFQAAWLTHEKFQEFVQSKWSNQVPLIPFLSKFSKDRQEWNKNVFHNIFQKKKES